MASIFIIDSNGRKEVSLKEICGMFGEDLNKILKNPLFKNNKNKRSKKNYLGSRAATHIIPYFRTKHPDNGKDIEIRYAESWEADRDRKDSFNYLPRRVSFYGETFRVDESEELAVWYFLNKKYRPKSRYEFVDTVKMAKESIDNVDNVEKALVLSRKVDDADLAILLKGLSRYFPQNVSNVDNMDITEQRAAFKNIALNHPKEFLNKIQGSAMAKVEGTILQLVDKGGIALLPTGPFRVWKWASGPKAGQPIGEVIKEVTADTKSILIREIVSNPEEYKDVLVRTLERVNADLDSADNSDAWGGFDISTAKSSMEELDVDKANSQAEVKTNTDAVMVLPEPTMDSVKEFCEKHGYMKGTPEVSKMRKEIEEGIITNDNIEIWCSRNLKRRL